MKKKISGKASVRAGKEFTLFISNGDMNDIKIIKSLKYLGVLIDGFTETVKHEIKKQKRELLGALLAPLATALVQSLISLRRSRVRRTGRRHMDKNF